MSSRDRASPSNSAPAAQSKQCCAGTRSSPTPGGATLRFSYDRRCLALLPALDLYRTHGGSHQCSLSGSQEAQGREDNFADRPILTSPSASSTLKLDAGNSAPLNIRYSSNKQLFRHALASRRISLSQLNRPWFIGHAVLHSLAADSHQPSDRK